MFLLCTSYLTFCRERETEVTHEGEHRVLTLFLIVLSGRKMTMSMTTT